MEERMRIALWDINPEVVFAWTRIFSGYDGVRLGCGSILSSSVDAVVSPANSYGRMDGGVDLAYRNFFGLPIEAKVMAVIKKRYRGELPVGDAFAVFTGHRRITRLIVAPTMKTLKNIGRTENVYLATRAALLCALEAWPPIKMLGFPGMGTGAGRMDPFECAEQMLRAYKGVFQPEAARLEDFPSLAARFPALALSDDKPCSEASAFPGHLRP
jgi:O-acetyl-ADP-ribose deacetylase (regulator of RNase III)